MCALFLAKIAEHTMQKQAGAQKYVLIKEHLMHGETATMNPWQ